MANSQDELTFHPLGGLGEIGLNCMAFKAQGSTVLVDCGLMFPEDYLFGVDVVIPRFEHILAEKEKLKAVVLTHGHEDHIGALPWLLPHIDVPVYGSDFTLALVNAKLKERGIPADLRPVKPGDRVEIGPFAFNFIPVCHSIIKGYALGIETPMGRVLHTGDFKIDRNPMDGHMTDMDAIRRFAEPGVKLLLSDSTNVERDGFALTEREIMASLREIFDKARGRIIVTLFSSHIQRLQEIFDLAAACGRKVAISGKSLARNIDLARELGYLRIPADTLLEVEETSSLPDEQVVLVVTGSQGEPLAALSRMSLDEHRQMRIKKGDLVLLSSRFIPGNVLAITKVINRLYKLGAEVLYEKVQAIHASGHAHREELRIMLEAVKPKYFVPIHGEYRHLVKHTRLAVECGVMPERAMVLEDGQPLTILSQGIRLEEAVPAERILVDGKGVGDVGQSVLKERQLLAGEGMVVVLLVIDKETGEITLGPDIVSKGFVFEQQYAHLLEDAKCVVLEEVESSPKGNIKKLKERVRMALRRFFRTVLDRDPVVVPLVIAI
jgi:ribonuclease J